MERIKRILRENMQDGVFHTHVSLINPRGKFLLNRSQIEEFWDVYCSMVDCDLSFDDSEFPTFGLAEKSQQFLPILVDVDLKVRDEGDVVENRLYTEEQLKSVVSIYQSVMRQVIQDCSDEDLICVVLEKNMYTLTKNNTTYLKHGFHLHFPYCFLDKKDQELQIIPRVKEELRTCNLFSRLGIENSGDVIDKGCCSVPWLTYGSRKNETAQPYEVTKVYDANLETVSLENAFKRYMLYNEREKLIPIAGKVSHYLPRILSIIPFNRQTKTIKKGIASPLKEQIKNKDRKTSTIHRKLDVVEALAIARKLVPLLADFRADDRLEWLNVGWVLYNISEGSNEGLDIWCEFSSRNEEKYNEDECIFEWEKMTIKGYSIGTLKHYAKQDNPIEYQKFKDAEARKFIEASLEGSHNDIAKALYAMYSDEFVCASVSNQAWYQFVGNMWRKIDMGVFLREKISGSFVNKYFEAIKELYNELRDAGNTKSKESLVQVKIKNVNGIIKNLKSAPFKNNVMREACEVFYDPDFGDRLDMDPYIIAFKNGVYDLNLNVFRPGRPEDYISKCMGVNYVNFTEDDERVQEVYTFFEQIFPDSSLRKYYMDVSADIFVGGNLQRVIIFYLGSGSNGKSVSIKLTELMFGPLSIKMNTNILTGKKPNPGAAYADLARSGGGVRQIVFDEPDPGEMINAGILKLLSGGDSYFTRDLFEKGKDSKEIQPMHHLRFVCNKLPAIRNMDRAAGNRCKILMFESEFCENPPETYEEQLRQKKFPIDHDLAKNTLRLTRMAEAFAWILLEHRKKNERRIEPDAVRIATSHYQKQNDIYLQFMEENIIADLNATISLSTLYSIYKDWYRESLPGQNLPTKNDIEEIFVKRWGPMETGKKWKGYKQIAASHAGGDVVLRKEDLVDYSNPMSK